MNRTRIRLAAFLVALALLPGFALAAPVRDLRRTDESGEDLRAMVSLAAASALMKGETVLEEGATPGQRLTEGMLLLGYARGLLPRTDGDPADGRETVSDGDAAAYLAALFETAPLPPQTPECPCITRSGASLTVDYQGVGEEQTAAARIYSSAENNGRLTVLADVYTTLMNWQTSAEETADECLNWVCAARFEFVRAPEALLGWKLCAFRMGPEWLAGFLNEWTAAQGGAYELLLPPSMQKTAEGEGWTLYEMPEGPASLTVSFSPRPGGDALSAGRAAYLSVYPDARVVMEPALSYVTMETEGSVTLLFAPDGSPDTCTLTLSFPPERQEEFSFYAEILRNTFWLEGFPAG